jgi:hypothetical protein
MFSNNTKRIALLCFAFALIVRFGILFGAGIYRYHIRAEMDSVALTFARTGEIGNAYMALPTGPTAHTAPLYPMLVGSIYRVFGDGETGERIKQILSSINSSLRSPLLVLLALALGLGPDVALAAGVVSALYIGAFETELKGDWEGPLAANVLILLVLWGHRLMHQRVPSAAEGLIYGVAWGVALLISPSLLPVAVGFAVLAVWMRVHRAPRRTAIAVVFFATGCGLALTPWIVRNYIALGGFVWGRDNFGLELSVSNGPGAHWSNPQNRPRIFSMHPSRYLPAAERLRVQGELAFNRDRQREAIDWIRNNPLRFARLTALRTIHFWFPFGRNVAHSAALVIFGLMAFAGLRILYRDSAPAFAIVAVVWGTYPLVYYIIQWSSRYRQPIDWSLILCASVFVNEGIRWMKRAAPISVPESVSSS